MGEDVEKEVSMCTRVCVGRVEVVCVGVGVVEARFGCMS